MVLIICCVNSLASLGIGSYEMILSPMESIKYKNCPAGIQIQNDAIIIIYSLVKRLKYGMQYKECKPYTNQEL